MNSVVRSQTAMAGQAGLLDELLAWKTKRQAVILAHNYQPEEVQLAADFTGDSLELSRVAAKTEAPVILFAGVTFMAESAKILSPDKTVLLPVLEARCPMADTIAAGDVRNARAEHPHAAFVAYVNSSVEVKAEVDVCCTSANAVQVVNALPQAEVVFVPDKNLADWVARHTAKRIIPWPGSCCTHHAMTKADVDAAQMKYPQALFIAHPECRPEVCAAAQAVLSTSGMLKFVRHHEASEFIIGTEIGLLHRLRLENPNKRFYALSQRMLCASMKMNSLAAMLTSLQQLTHPVEIPEPIRRRAAMALEAMVGLVPA